MNPLGKLYIGNLPWRATEAELKEFFSSFGKVQSASIVTDRDTGRSRGFGFVEMATAPEAEAAVTKFNGQDVDGRTLKVERANPPGSGGRVGGGRPGGRW